MRSTTRPADPDTAAKVLELRRGQGLKNRRELLLRSPEKDEEEALPEARPGQAPGLAQWHGGRQPAATQPLHDEGEQALPKNSGPIAAQRGDEIDQPALAREKREYEERI